MRVLFVVIGLLFISFVSVAEAELLTGCMTPGGSLKNMNFGDQPAFPCGNNDQLVQWEIADDSTSVECPCDFLSTLHFADWQGPSCYVNRGNLQLSSVWYGPAVYVSDGRWSNPNIDSYCGIDVGYDTISKIYFSGIDVLEACKFELDELAKLLGSIDGCSDNPPD